MRQAETRDRWKALTRNVLMQQTASQPELRIARVIALKLLPRVAIRRCRLIHTGEERERSAQRNRQRDRESGCEGLDAIVGVSSLGESASSNDHSLVTARLSQSQSTLQL